MFADNINLSCPHKNMKILFKSVNGGLEKVSQWFKANKRLRSEGKT